MPKHVSSGLLFGNPLLIPVPDLDRTDYLLMLGANPWESNGSLCTAPDFPGRVKAIQARGGKVVVVDPRRSRTAEEADEHVADPARHRCPPAGGHGQRAVRRGPGRPRPTSPPHVAGVDEVRGRGGAVHPRGGGRRSRRRRRRSSGGWPASWPPPRRAAVYGRIGTHTVEFGTIASWAVDVLNVLTGNLDRPGGAMFPLAAHERAGARRARAAASPPAATAAG